MMVGIWVSNIVLMLMCHQRVKKHTICPHLLPHDPRAEYLKHVPALWPSCELWQLKLGNPWVHEHTPLLLLLFWLFTAPTAAAARAHWTRACHALKFSPFTALKSMSITFNPRVQPKLSAGLKYTGAQYTFRCFVLLWGQPSCLLWLYRGEGAWSHVHTTLIKNMLGLLQLLVYMNAQTNITFQSVSKLCVNQCRAFSNINKSTLSESNPGQWFSTGVRTHIYP